MEPQKANTPRICFRTHTRQRRRIGSGGNTAWADSRECTHWSFTITNTFFISHKFMSHHPASSMESLGFQYSCFALNTKRTVVDGYPNGNAHGPSRDDFTSPLYWRFSFLFFFRRQNISSRSERLKASKLRSVTPWRNSLFCPFSPPPPPRVFQHFSKSTKLSSWTFWNLAKFCKFCEICKIFAEFYQNCWFFKPIFC